MIEVAELKMPARCDRIALVDACTEPETEKNAKNESYHDQGYNKRSPRYGLSNGGLPYRPTAYSKRPSWSRPGTERRTDYAGRSPSETINDGTDGGRKQPLLPSAGKIVLHLNVALQQVPPSPARSSPRP